MAKATLDDLLKEQKKQTKLLKEMINQNKQQSHTTQINTDEIIKNLQVHLQELSQEPLK